MGVGSGTQTLAAISSRRADGESGPASDGGEAGAWRGGESVVSAAAAGVDAAGSTSSRMFQSRRGGEATSRRTSQSASRGESQGRGPGPRPAMVAEPREPKPGHTTGLTGPNSGEARARVLSGALEPRVVTTSRRIGSGCNPPGQARGEPGAGSTSSDVRQCRESGGSRGDSCRQDCVCSRGGDHSDRSQSAPATGFGQGARSRP